MKIAFLDLVIGCQRILGCVLIAGAVIYAFIAAVHPGQFLEIILCASLPMLLAGFGLFASAALLNLFLCMALDLRELRCRATSTSDAE